MNHTPGANRANIDTNAPQGEPPRQPFLTLDPDRSARALGAFVAFLALAHLGGVVSRHALGHDHIFGLIRLFDLDRENNIPTLFSSWMLVLNGGLLATVAVLVRKRAGNEWLYWAGLAAIFTFLSVDELWSIHEGLIEPLRQQFGASGVFHFAWVIPYGIGVAVIAASSLRFLLRMQRDVRWSFIAAAGLYVGGAIGVEMVGGRHAVQFGENNAMYGLITMTEELLELAGLVVLTRSILAFARAEFGEVHLQFQAPSRARAARAASDEQQPFASDSHHVEDAA